MKIIKNLNELRSDMADKADGLLYSRLKFRLQNGLRNLSELLVTGLSRKAAERYSRLSEQLNTSTEGCSMMESIRNILSILGSQSEERNTSSRRKGNDKQGL